MNLSKMKSLAMTGLAVACMALPALGSAQRWPQDYDQDYRYGNNRYDRDIRSIVDRTERESNSFRQYFERNFRSRGNERRYDYNDYDNHPEHQSRSGQMTLRDTIQNLDEAMERLRAEVNRGGMSRRAEDIAQDVREHAAEVDQRIGRVSTWYDWTGSYNDRYGDYNGRYGNNGRYGRNQDWTYNRSDLSSRWSQLRRDINDVVRMINGR